MLVPLSLCAIAAVAGWRTWGRSSFICWPWAGFLAPDFWLGKKIAARQKKSSADCPMCWICW